MIDEVKIAFERRVHDIPVSEILPSRALSAAAKATAKYRRIVASVAEVGLVEPLVVARMTQCKSYLLADGHVRFEVLKARGAATAPCLIADDDEGFTYNKRVNRLSPVHEHYMIVRALERGVSEERLARALSLDIYSVRSRRNLLIGIAPEVVEVLKNKPTGRNVFQKLRKMKPLRQLEVAELMVAANNYSVAYATALLAVTKPADLLQPDLLPKATGLSPEQMARLERDVASVGQDYKELETSYGDDMLVLVIAAGFIERLISRPAIENFLAVHHPELLESFRGVVAASSLDQGSAVAA